MKQRRIIFQNWALEHLPNAHGPSPDQQSWLAGLAGTPRDADPGSTRVQRIVEAVRQAVSRLDPLERLVIETVYYHGETLASLEAQTGRAGAHFRKLHQRALKKLKRHLQGFVAEEFGLTASLAGDCPLCRNEHRQQIDEIIRSRHPHETWRPVLNKLKTDFALTRLVPSQIIGHVKYH